MKEFSSRVIWLVIYICPYAVHFIPSGKHYLLVLLILIITSIYYPIISVFCYFSTQTNWNFSEI